MRVVRIGNATLYLADYREVLPSLAYDALVSDPPYGVGYEISERNNTGVGLTATGPTHTRKRAPIEGDLQPFDPSPFLGASKIALFGANHFKERLPHGGRWIVWDKRRDSVPDDHSDCEFVWLNIDGADRIHRQKWRGVVREGEENCSRSKKLHPNQKPVALIAVIFNALKISTETVCDPFMGSGSTGIVALRRGNPFVGIEKDAEHFETAVDRLSKEQPVLPTLTTDRPDQKGTT